MVRPSARGRGACGRAFGLGALAYWLLGTCADTFGTIFATVNLSLLYTAKGTSAFLVPIANVLKSFTVSWHVVFGATAFFNILVVALPFVLKRMRARMMAKSEV